MQKSAIVMTALALVLGLVSWWTSAMGWDGKGQHPSSQSASIERGKKVYADQCLTCHQVDGGGVQDMTPTLIKTKWVLGDKTQLVQIVIKGLKGGEVQIDGDSFHNVMPPHPDLTDQQIADLLTYVRNSFGNKASAVRVSEVTAARAKIK
jgi:mono/diheme cytochrome c family protein